MAALSTGPENRSLAAAPDGSPVEKAPAARRPSRQDKGARPPVCVVVLGSGRSGTSLTARILGELGVRMNYNPAQISDQNLDGAFEDEVIYKAHSTFFDVGGFARIPPLPAGWMASEAAAATAAQLEKYVRQEFGSDALWGFKDPRTSVLLPLWKPIFNRARIVPRYIVCARSPAAFVQSMANNYRIDQSDAELVWLTRTVGALRDTGLNCFILHYERLLADPLRTIRMLAKYVLGAVPDPAQLKAITAECINPKFDRAKINSVVLTNPIIQTLAAALEKCEGADFARQELTEALQNCDRILTAFAPHLGRRRTETSARGARGAAGASEPQPEGELAKQWAEWRRQAEASTKRHMQRVELLQEQLTGQRVQWQQQAAAHGEETARLNQRIGELEALSAARGEEAARLGADLAPAVALAAERAEEIARLGNRLTQQQAHLADSEAQLTEMTLQLEQLVEQHRLQSIELKWAGTDRENLNVKLAALVAAQTVSRRAPSPAGQPLAASNGGPAPAPRSEAAATGEKPPKPLPNGASSTWTVRALLRAPRSYLQTWRAAN
ncbi:MAG TPA: hypothetical protein VGS13_15335 [Stellaceae bacterium]|nr:hypothetical protein [Stellaceae bacterium]